MANLKFCRYSDIENSYQEKFLKKIKEIVPADEIWMVKEKIHGANYSFSTDGNTVKAGCRSMFLLGKDDGKDDQKKFYNSDVIVNENKDRILSLWKIYKEQNPDLKILRVYGEIFCTDYPGLVRKDKKVSKGVYYSPTVKWLAFDVTLDDKYINYWEATKNLSFTGLPYVNVSFMGILDDCLKWSEEHYADESTIPSYYGYPELKDNIREGNVIVPLNEYRIGQNNSRVILKHKNDKFSERSSEKKNPNKKKEDTSMSADLQRVTDEIVSYITENRLDNVISKDVSLVKQGEEYSKAQISKIGGIFAKDVIDNYITDNDELYNSLNDKEKKRLKSYVQKFCFQMVLKLN